MGNIAHRKRLEASTSLDPHDRKTHAHRRGCRAAWLSAELNRIIGVWQRVAQDYSMWEAILTQLGAEDAALIIADTRESNRNATIMRDYSGLQRLAEDLGITGQIDFDFRPTLKTASVA